MLKTICLVKFHTQSTTGPGGDRTIGHPWRAFESVEQALDAAKRIVDQYNETQFTYGSNPATQRVMWHSLSFLELETVDPVPYEEPF